MTHDVQMLITWIRVVQVIGSVSITGLVLIYSTRPWWTTTFGRLFMLLAISFMVAMDLTTIFSFWRPRDIRIMLWLDAIFLTGIAVSTTLLAIRIWSAGRPWRRTK